MNRKTILLAACAALVASACRAPQAGAPRPVTLMLDWTPNTNHTGVYVALAKGWYKEEGITLEIQQPGAATIPNQVVAEGQAQFGVSYQEQVTLDRSQGLPVVSIAAVIQHNTSGFAGAHDSGIDEIADLAGKRYGSFGSPWEQPFLDALLKCAGADAGTIQVIQLGPTSDYRALLGRDIDFAWVFWAWDGVASEVAGQPYQAIMLKDHTDCVPDYYTPVLVAGEKLIADDPDLVRRFMRATARGYDFAIQNPDEAADLLLQQVPELKPTADIVKASARWLAGQYRADAPRWGEQKAEVWSRFAEFALKAGILPQSIDAGKAYTNAFLP
jgi:ABC-type nitrate/sulfonate/bicarbonate transport system substrate-binding protein